jgi:histidyl-tRNA synthetase
MKYADQKKIPYVVLVGEDEINSGLLTVKNMSSGLQEKLPLENLIRKIRPA